MKIRDLFVAMDFELPSKEVLYEYIKTYITKHKLRNTT